MNFSPQFAFQLLFWLCAIWIFIDGTRLYRRRSIGRASWIVHLFIAGLLATLGVML